MATVFVWNNNMVATAHKYSGHASMNIDDNWKVEGVSNYVSFWPENNSAGQGATLTSGAHNATSNTCLEQDMKSEGGYVPDHIIRLSGVNVGNMKGEWQALKRDCKQYTMARDNCSAAVARVLKKGSNAGGVVHRHSVIWTPLNVKRLAMSMGGKKILWRDFLDEVVAGGGLSADSAAKLAAQPKRSSKHGSSGAISTHVGRYQLDKPVETNWIRPMPTMASGGAMVNAPPASDRWEIFNAIDEAEGA